MAKKFSRFLYQPCAPLGNDGRCVTGSAEHIALSRKAATEGMVLLKNENNALPLKKGEKIALFGKSTIDYVKGGGGSGDVFVSYVRDIYDGFKIKEDEGKVTVFKPLVDFYKSYVAEQKDVMAKKSLELYAEFWSLEETPDRERAFATLNFELQIAEPQIPDELFKVASVNADTAIITISRFSGEGWDRSSGKADFYLTDAENELVDRVTAAFKKVIVVMDVGGMIDSEWFKNNDKISASLLAWQAGMEGGLAVADIICGDVNPSGKLVDTFAKTFDDYPSSKGFNDSDDFIDYTEDIYVGYRYFETIPGADKKVNYPFGYGLSFTNFEFTGLHGFDDGKAITVTVKVKNTGDKSGKETVQVYYGAPDGVLGKPKKSLVAFQKTRLLKPGEAQTIAISFDIADMASFDDTGKLKKSAYVLEKGDYKIFIGNSVENVKELSYKYVVEKDYIITSELRSCCAPVALDKRMLSDGSYETLSKEGSARETVKNKPNTAKAPKELTMFDTVKTEDDLDAFMAQLTDDELINMMGGDPNTGVANTFCFAGAERLGVPSVPTADGPAGLRLNAECGIPTTAWPCATLIACTWNTDLMYEIGRAGAEEVKENNIGVWLTPAMNIHRSPLCGRNFEYFSEDPVVAGKMAAAKVNGIQSMNIAACVKHFAANNKEINRFQSDSRVSERALREIYLKGFEICVKESNPWSLMTSYNRINGVRTSENYQLITDILRGEWGFKGMITTDWGRKNDPVRELLAGNDTKMPVGYPEELKDALSNGTITRADLEVCARRMLQMYLKLD